MSFKVQAAMASALRGDDTKPRRFDLSMSRRTRRPAAATSSTSRHEQDHLQSRQPELDAHQEHQQTSEQRQRSEDTTKEQVSPPLTCLVQKKDDESEARQQQEEEECQDNSRRFSLQELIEDEAVDDGVVKSGGTEENAAAVRDVAEGTAAAERRTEQVPGRRVIGMMRRYVKVRSIKPKPASPEKNTTPVC